MPLTPAQLRGLTFGKPPIGKRGYDEDEVDAFLELVEAELARLLEDNTALRTQLAQCDPQPGLGAIDTAAAPAEPTFPPRRPPPPAGEEDHHHHAANVLHRAQRTAQRVTSQAQADAEALLNQARAPRRATATRSPGEGRGPGQRGHHPGADRAPRCP
jgi:DivIVA domain-containing protein